MKVNRHTRTQGKPQHLQDGLDDFACRHQGGSASTQNTWSAPQGQSRFRPRASTRCSRSSQKALLRKALLLLDLNGTSEE